MTKTFKIGEEAIGGIIQVSTRPKNVFDVKCLDYETKEIISWRFVFGLEELQEYCEDLSTPYWADQIVSYFKNKLK